MRQIILAINALLKFKAYTLINVLGLACSLACVLTVARYIHQENTVNQCFPEYKRICLIKTSTSSGENFLGGYRSGLEKNPDSNKRATGLKAPVALLYFFLYPQSQ